ncbi:MAG TPA: DUF2089 family protein [Fimbriimonadales bacterium]|jgi:hypothetical protein|nr:DUF2089 family protein [Fimbriimonadales bacterium]
MSGNPKTHDHLPPGMLDLGEWHISEFTNEEAELKVRGRFRMSPFQKLSQDHADFLMSFLRCRGVISSVEKDLGISYPTVRSRLDGLLRALELAPAADAAYPGARGISERHKEILEKLDSGELSPEEAKKAMKEAAK